MTPGARISAAISVLDRVAAGEPAEKALTNWARGARYAGSKDRAAVRDHVFDVLRRWRSTAMAGGAETGRGRMIGLLRQDGPPPENLFDGQGHAPAPLTDDERATCAPADSLAVRDMPDWLWPQVARDLGAQADPVAEELRHRAPVFVRVNTLKADVETAIAALAAEGIEARPAPLSPTALEIVAGARGIARGPAFAAGLVEMQDAASQAVVDALPLASGMRVMDYCAGGGGKALAMAARMGGGPVAVHDAEPSRMRDVPARAARAGADLRIVDGPRGAWDLVLCDVPCSGIGAWRRAPEGKWRLTQDMLDALCRTQAEILDRAAPLVAPDGVLAYATCSILACENLQAVERFVAGNPNWVLRDSRSFLPGPDGDGLFVAVLARTG